MSRRRRQYGCGGGTLLAGLLLMLFAAGMAAGAVHPASAGDAATIDLRESRQPVTVVSTQWRFHPGDDPGWAQPGFDDSGWGLIAPSQPWTAQGYREEGGLAWYRFRLKLAPGTTEVAMVLPSTRKNYQLFADGTLIAQLGGLPPQRSAATSGAARVFMLPVHPDAGPHVMTVALRLWQSPQYAWINPNILTEPALVGAPKAVLAQFDRAKSWNLVRRRGMDYTMAAVEMPIFAAALLLFLLTRQRFYLWFCLSMCTSAFEVAAQLAYPHFGWSYAWMVAAFAFLDFAGTATMALFVAGLLGLKKSRLVGAAIAAQALADLLTLLVAIHFPSTWADGSYFFLSSTAFLIVLWLALRGYRAGAVDAGLFLVPFALSFGLSALGNLGHYLVDLGLTGVEAWIPSEIVVLERPFPVTLLDVSNLLALFGFLAVLVYRFARTSREEQRLTAALRAAHELQSRLVPAEKLSYGGMRTEVVYLAAEEVGGDFCQVLPRKDGSVLIAIGDVSGKGLEAAMVGTLAVGALRSLATEDVDPATILIRLNEVMMRSDQEGFITCLCIAIEPGGELTLANAGHLLPYVNGNELECCSGLPLGLLENVEYEQRQMLLPPDARVTLLSDGVVEARSLTGELFGFERTREMSERRAADIAAAAKRFGQRDDITVMTLDWAGAAVAV